jgi:pterin-4a-carbinolamine dehydratase
MPTSATAFYSEAEDPKQLEVLVAALLAEGGGRWHLTSTGKGLEREFQFKTFKKAWVGTHHQALRILSEFAKDFMNIVASKSGKERHHPEWSNVSYIIECEGTPLTCTRYTTGFSLDGRHTRHLGWGLKMFRWRSSVTIRLKLWERYPHWEARSSLRWLNL